LTPITYREALSQGPSAIASLIRSLSFNTNCKNAKTMPENAGWILVIIINKIKDLMRYQK
jgi:hypothetical protein